jgi:hypothetical protein
VTPDKVAWLYRYGDMLMMYEIMGRNSDGTAKQVQCFEGDRSIVYKWNIVGVTAFPFFSLYLFSCIAKQVTTFKQL